MNNIALSGLTIYIIAHRVVEEVYGLSKVACILLITLVTLTAVLEVKKTWCKLLLTFLSLITLTLHYSIITLLTQYIKVRVMPFVTIELNEEFNTETISIDYGQILTLFIALMWRNELIKAIKAIIKRLVKTTLGLLKGREKLRGLWKLNYGKTLYSFRGFCTNEFVTPNNIPYVEKHKLK